jgi:signal peptidase I
VPNPRRSQGVRLGRIVFWVLVVLCAAALIGGATTVLTTARSFTEPSTSMENTIMPGDTVVVDRTLQVHRGDVIVEEQPSTGPGYYIRRVIGVPGDHVACCDVHGRITVNGKALDETYLYLTDAPAPARFNITVPVGKLWLLGDHRSIARDSRTEGALAVEVVGRVFLIVRSGHATFLQVPQTFIARGLAPASEPTPAAVIGLGVLGLALGLLLALTIFGIVRYAIHRHRRSPLPEPHPMGHTWDGAQL